LCLSGGAELQGRRRSPASSVAHQGGRVDHLHRPHARARDRSGRPARAGWCRRCHSVLEHCRRHRCRLRFRDCQRRWRLAGWVDGCRCRRVVARIELWGHRQTLADSAAAPRGALVFARGAQRQPRPLDDQQKCGRVDHLHRPHARAREIDQVDRLGPAGAGVAIPF
jgi:hypothetical protein